MNDKVKIVKVFKKDAKQIINFLKKNHNFDVNYNDFFKLFNSTKGKNSEIGYAIYDKKKIFGFFGIKHSSNNKFPGKNYSICNMHTWVVHKKYRNYSLLLLDRIAKTKKIIVSHSSIIQLNKTFFKYGFKVLDKGYYLLNCISYINFFYKRINYQIDKVSSESNYKKILKDHLHCNYHLLNLETEKCVVIFQKKKIAFFTYIIIYNVSNCDYFNKNLKSILRILNSQYNCCFLKIDSRFIKKSCLFAGLYIKYKYMNKLYKIPKNFKISDFEKCKIDNLYSELQYL